LEKSSTSSTIDSRCPAERLTVSTYSRCTESSSVSESSSVMPMTPFIGVRISWLMLARNSLLVRVASSEASFARTSAASPCLRAVSSWATVDTPTGLPLSPSIGVTVRITSTG
jgi:hypothetical protein